MTPKFHAASGDAIPIDVLAKSKFATWLPNQPQTVQSWVQQTGFKAGLGEVLLLPNETGGLNGVLLGWGDHAARHRGRFHFAKAAEVLPEGVYRLQSGLPKAALDEAALGWLLAGYRFGKYKSKPQTKAHLVAPEGVDTAKIEAIAAAEFLTRDLINTPTNDMGPDDLEAAFHTLGRTHGAKTTAMVGDELLAQNFPLIHAVGRASDQASRLLELNWGNEGHPTVTLVGKGVCFDTGGLNIKPGSSMGLMKKDMGGAATVLGLAQLIMAQNLPVRLRVLVPAVENAISAGAFRPGDVLTSRKGLTVEVNNTDAEGRLVLADALALADENAPDYLICMATLTGAARVALGPDLAPFYTDDDGLSHALGRAGRKVADPLWRMPFWEPYEDMIEPAIADLDNAPAGGFAGSITAALFLRRFVENAERFAHFDIYGWNPKAAPARPKGAAFLGARAIFEMLEQKI
jgi:leucyl aminopeptidase